MRLGRREERRLPLRQGGSLGYFLWELVLDRGVIYLIEYYL